MTGTRAAIRYAKAILDMAQTKNVAVEVNNDMVQIASTINTNAELTAFIQNPTLSVDTKYNAILEVFGDTNSVTKGLFKLLLENKRFEILSSVASEYVRIYDEINGVETATVTTAVEMDSDLEAKVLTKILSFSNKKVLIKNIVDPSIIGGFILRIGDKQYNASIANRLQGLKRELNN
jgi:F-type H+-transporting ATPase subunit delta